MNEMEIRSPAMLFPHCFIDEDRLKGAIALFGSLEICLPWEMRLTAGPLIEEPTPFLKILRPAETLRPGPGFGRLLADYREWIKRHQDKSVLAFLSSLQDRDSFEENSWEIRKRMRREPSQTEAIHEEQTLKHHLLLHLSAETEESHHMAESLIGVLKTSRAPLSGALDTEDSTVGLFDDLPSLNDPSLWQEYQWSQIVEAWFGLFHHYLADEKILLALDPGLTDFIEKRFEKALGETPDRLFLETIALQLSQFPPTLSMDEISKTGHRFFRQEVLDRLEATLGNERDKPAQWSGTPLKDPIVRGLLGKTLIVLEP